MYKFLFKERGCRAYDCRSLASYSNDSSDTSSNSGLLKNNEFFDFTSTLDMSSSTEFNTIFLPVLCLGVLKEIFNWHSDTDDPDWVWIGFSKNGPHSLDLSRQRQLNV